MTVLYVLVILIFDLILCIIEIPKMLKKKYFGQISAFSVLLILGTVLAVLRIFKIEIPNPSDLILWIYSPFAEVIKMLK